MQGLMKNIKDFGPQPVQKALSSKWHDSLVFHKDHLTCSEKNGWQDPKRRHKAELVKKL